MNLYEELAQTEAKVEALRKQIAQGPCKEFGHTWVFYGGRNAGCSNACQCSIPVNICSKCAECDYGDNKEAIQIREDCASGAV